MSDNTKIPWAGASLNFATGCNKVSAGCANCYALERTIPRLKACGQKKYQNGSTFTVHEEAMYAPLKWKTPKRIFVNSVSDTFHERMPYPVLDRFFEKVVANTLQHTYILLTKRANNMNVYFKDILAPPNVWVGVTAENQKEADQRLPCLHDVHAKVRFVSVEPMLGPVDLSAYAEWLDWIIIGCESGPNRRPCFVHWMVDLINQSRAMGIPVYLKQREISGKIVNQPWIIPDLKTLEQQTFLEYPG